jgi:exodeoxyribonuclease VII large subunit
LLFKKLSAEGLFAEERKRPLPHIPQKIGLITAADSAAAADFTKILNERWGGVEVLLADVYVQGEQAPMQLVEAIEHLNQISEIPEVLVVTRGGGSADDLAAFNDERVIRAVAAAAYQP